MAALQPPVGGLTPPDFSRRSFADVLATSSAAISSHAMPSIEQPLTEQPSNMGTHKGYPAITFKSSHVENIARPFRWSLVGKFTQGFNKANPKLGRPSVEHLHDYFRSLDFKGDFSVGLLDNRHILIQLQLEEDYLRLYSRMVWYVGGVAMRIFKWTTRLKLMENVSSFVSLFIGEGNEEGDGVNLFGPVVHYSSVRLALSTSVYVIETPHAARQ